MRTTARQGRMQGETGDAQTPAGGSGCQPVEEGGRGGGAEPLIPTRRPGRPCYCCRCHSPVVAELLALAQGHPLGGHHAKHRALPVPLVENLRDRQQEPRGRVETRGARKGSAELVGMLPGWPRPREGRLRSCAAPERQVLTRTTLPRRAMPHSLAQAGWQGKAAAA